MKYLHEMTMVIIYSAERKIRPFVVSKEDVDVSKFYVPINAMKILIDKPG